MAPNRHQSHLLILPEDRANQEIATGFRLYEYLVDSRIQVLPVAGGWTNVIALFLSDHVVAMEQLTGRFIVLLIDFDNRKERRQQVNEEIPAHLRDRVFLLGTLSKPEKLKSDLGSSYETIGLALAKDCREQRKDVWSHTLLVDNATELERLRRSVASFLFR